VVGGEEGSGGGARPKDAQAAFGSGAKSRGNRLYDSCAITSHNADPAVPGAGSAIFVHLWRCVRWPTAGCIAFRRSDLEWILARWRPTSRLVISAGGGL